MPAPVAAETTSIRGPAMPSASRRDSEVAGDQARVRIGQAVGLVEDEAQAVGVRSQAAPVLVLSRVVVLLGVDHPSHRVDPRQEGVDEDAVLNVRRVDVGQVEDRDLVESVAVMLDHARDIQPVEQRRELRAVAGWRPRPPASRWWGGWPAPGSPSVPARALRTDDFPTPVPPASAMT